ncbi:MAG: DUF962 domain-containing protein [Chitinophagaceae bacterium]|nr:MAG: DUF962 domain-containing protein [Chitinophagaceae bacterium]
MKRMQQWLDEYGESHRNETNKLIHWICVPAIFFSITGLLYSIKLPFSINDYRLNMAVIALLLVWFYYLRLSPALSVGMLLFGASCLALCHLIEVRGNMPLWFFSIVVFVLAWIGQFFGHKIEGKKPSFLKDLQFLMIGPAWLMSFVYRKMGVKY